MRSFIIIILILAICGAAPVLCQSDQVQIPSTPAGKLLEKILISFNSGDVNNWREFIEKNWKKSDDPNAAERRLGFFKNSYEISHAFQVVKIVNSSDHEITVLLHAEKFTPETEWLNFTLLADGDEPNKVAMISIEPADNPKFDVADRELSQSEMIAFLDSYIDDLVKNELFSGTVLIAKDGRPIYTRVEGEACKRYHVPNQLDTKFNLGSMNKMFTSVAIMQLMEQGKLALDDKVGKYLPALPRPEIADKVTIFHLLTHTSGMQDYWDEIFAKPFWEIRTVSQMGELIFDDSLLFEPGTDFHYSNSGPILLGMIIEKITGQDYFDYVRENIYQPAGMVNSDCYAVDTPTPNLAIGYTHLDYNGSELPADVWRNNLFLHVNKGGPAGGGYSTVEDLLAFDQALRHNKLLKQETFEKMITGVSQRRENVRYACLFENKTVNGQTIVGHGGGAPGINSMLEMYLDSGYTVAVMSNYDYGAGKVVGKIRELLTK